MRRRTSPEQADQAQAARQEKLDQLHQQLMDGIESLQSSERWLSFLQFAQGFHRYSFNNTLLIYLQKPDATLVASFNAWKERGHHVRKGETALRVLAPMTRRVPAEDHQGDLIRDKNGEPIKKTIIVGFKPVPVFDASQVEPPVDRPDLPRLLAGQAPEGLWDSLATLVAQENFRLERGPCGEANGYTDFTSRVIRVRDDVDDAQAVKTLAHEVGHMLLHAPEDGGRLNCRSTLEVEAESVAYLVSSAHGLDTSEYTFSYVASWAQEAAQDGHVYPSELIQSTGQRVMACADKVLTHTQPPATLAQNQAMTKDIDHAREQAETRAAATPEPPPLRPLSSSLHTEQPTSHTPSISL